MVYNGKPLWKWMIWGLPLLLEIPISPFQTNLVELWLLVKQRFQVCTFLMGHCNTSSIVSCPCLLQKVSHGFLTIYKKFTTKYWCESTKWNGMRTTTTTTTTGVDKKTGGDVSQLGLLGMWWKCLDANSLVMKQWWKWPTITSFCSFKVWTEAYLTSGNRPPCIWWHLHLPSRGR